MKSYFYCFNDNTSLLMCLQKDSLESLLNEAEKLEKRYEWLQATEAYEKASTVTLANKDFKQMTMIEEQKGYCFFRAALQAKTNEDFKSKIKRAKETYEKFLKKPSTSDKAKTNHIKAMAAFAGSYLELDLLKKRNMLDLWWSLEKEAIKIYEQDDDLFSSGRISNIFNEYSTFDLLQLAENWADQKEIIEEAISFGEKAIEIFSKADDDSELARAYCWTGWYYGWAIGHGVNRDREEEFGKKGLEYSEKAIALSEKTGNAWLIGWSNNAASLIHFYYTINLASALSYCESFQAHGKIAQDNNMLLIGQWWGAMCTSAFATNLIEDPDEQREGFEKAIKLASEAILKAKIMASYLIFLPCATLSSTYLQLARIEPNPEVKQVLLEKSLRAAREYYDPKYSTGLHYNNVLGNLCTVIYSLAKLGKDSSARSRLLQEAFRIKTEEIAFVKGKNPENRLSLNMALSTSSLIQSELAKIEQKKEKRIELLEDAVLKMEYVLEDLSENLNEKFSAIVAGFSGRYYYWLGGILFQLYLENKEKKVILHAVRSYDAASKLFCKINLETHAAESCWHKAMLEDKLGEYVEAASSYQAAAEHYENASSKITQLREFYKNYSLYMQGWSNIEQARYAHSIEDYDKAKNCYESAAKLHQSTDSWSYLASNYLAWASMEEAEGLSRKENTQQAKETFQKAISQFTITEKSINQKIKETLSTEEKDLNQRLLEASDLRRRFCQARIQIEEAKLLDREGRYLQSSRRYGDAAQKLGSIIEKIGVEAERKELEYLSTLCRAWEKMAGAEETSSSDAYLEAAELFQQAREHCYTSKASLWALGNSSFCRGLAAGIQYQITTSLSDNALAKRHIKNAASSYLQAGLKDAAEYAKATLHLFDAYVFMNQAEGEVDPEKKARQYQIAENLLQIASGSFVKAQQLEKAAQIRQILGTVREEKALASSLTMVMQAPTIVSSTSSFSAPSPTSEASVGLEQFQHANVQANLIAGLKEVKVGESFCLTVEFVNAGKEPALLTRVEDFVPQDFVVVKKPEIYRIEESCLNMKGKQIAPLKLVEAKLVLQPSKKGVYQLKPTVHYLDERGQRRSLQLKAVEVRVEEVILSDRVSTGTKELDSLLLGGIPKEYAVVLTGSPSDERDFIIRNFIKAGIKENQTSFYVATEAVGLENLLEKSGVYLFLCNPKPKVDVPDLPNVHKLLGKTDLTNLNIALLKAYRSVEQSSKKRVCLEVVSDVLLRYGAEATRRWVSELVTDLVSKGFTILAVLDPSMHPVDQANAVINLFDGEISITQTEDPLECKKSIRIRNLRNQDYIKNPICLT